MKHARCHELETKLTFEVEGFGNTRIVRCFFPFGDGMNVPIHAVELKEESVQLASVLPNPTTFKGSLRPIQIEPVKRMYSDLCTYGTSLAYLFTGFGKTACAIFLAACFRPSKLVIYVHKHSLQLQWKDAILKFLDSTSVSIRTIQKQLRCLDEMHQFDKSTFVVFDETHHVAAECFSQMLLHSNAGYHLAVSATSARKDGLEKMLELFLGRPSATLTDLPFKPSVYISKYKGSPELYNFKFRKIFQKDVLDYNDVLERLCGCEERNAHIIGILRKVSTKNILVLSRRRKHVMHLCDMASEYLPDCRLLLGSMSEAQINQAKRPEGETKFILFATTSAAGEGFDLEDLQCIVLATPSTSVQQEVGRILRKKNEALVVDIVDECGVLMSQYHKRKRFYSEQKLAYVTEVGG